MPIALGAIAVGPVWSMPHNAEPHLGRLLIAVAEGLVAVILAEQVLAR